LSGVTGVYLAILTILLGGLVQSGSRGGMLAFTCGLIVFLLLSTRRPFLTLAIASLVVGLLMSLPNAHLLLDRFIWLAEGPGDERTRLYALTIEGISLRPWAGWGMGSFEGVYSLLQPLDLANSYYVMAHDSYLELALDLGIPAAAGLPLAILWIVGRFAIGLRERHWHKELLILAISATVLVGVHSLFDFSLQLPAVAITFTTILGIGWAQSWSTRRTG
jgi:O-antigen ligase